MKYLTRSGTRQAADMTELIEKRISLIEKFIQARKLLKRDPDTMVSICENLLQDPMLEEAIRAGDCLAMLVEYFHDSGRMRDAYTYIKEMESRKIALHPYVDGEILDDIFKAMGLQSPGKSELINSKSQNMGGKFNDGGDDEVEEDVNDEEVSYCSRLVFKIMNRFLQVVEEEEEEEDSHRYARPGRK